MNLEPLETRIAPAAVFTFIDVDGDIVKATTSLGTNADLTTAATIVAGQLRSLNLEAFVFQNANVSASVVNKSATGDGVVNIGRIDASGRDLGNVIISGDLGAILCGDGDETTPGLDLLSVRSMGIYGSATQGGGTDLSSAVEGKLGALKVAADLKNVSVGARAFGTRADGSIGTVTIGGALDGAFLYSTGDMSSVKIARDLIGGSTLSSGQISCGGKLVSLKIGGSMIGGTTAFTGEISAAEIGAISIGHDLIGGSGDASGLIFSSGNLASLTVGGSLIGGIGNQRFISGTTEVEGQIIVRGDIGTIRIANNVVGTSGLSTAKITSFGAIESLTVGSSVVGGPGGHSAAIESGGNIGAVRIGLDLKGGAGDDSGKIAAGGKLLSATIGGSVLGGSGDQNTITKNLITQLGQVFAVRGIGLVKIAGDVIGGAGISSGGIVAGTGNDATIHIDSVAIAGSLVGGAGFDSGSVLSAGHIGAASIGRSVVGGTGDGTGGVSANGGDLTSVTIGGSLIGGGDNGQFTGFLFSRGDLGTVLIKGDLLGGSGVSSGLLSSFGRLAKITINGSLIGGIGESSGSIRTNGAIGAVSIGHDLLGGSIPGQSVSLFASGYIESQDRIDSILVGGSIISGTDGSGGAETLIKNGSIRATRDIGSLTVRGGLIGNVSPNGDSPVIISAGGPTPVAAATTDLAIGRISIGGRVEWAQIFAGYDVSLTPLNADAQIGAVTVGADLIASSIVVGAVNLGADFLPGGTGPNADNVNFGELADRKITEAGELAGVVSRIGSIAISGQVFGTAESFRTGDFFGFVAEQIGSLEVGARIYSLNSGPGNDGFNIDWRTDTVGRDATLHEIGALLGFSSTITDSAKRVSASTVTYQDKDGDKVTVTFSKPVLTDANVNAVFRFDTGTVNDGVPAWQQLYYLDLRPLASDGLGLSVSVTRGSVGDGLAHIGAIVSTGCDVGVVKIPGDLGQIDAGNANLNTAGVGSLTVRTVGRFGLDTQGPQSVVFIPDLQSTIVGRLGALTVQQDIVDAFVNVNGSIGSVIINGSLIGGADINTGSINATGAIGAVKIGHHLQGGFGDGSGAISTTSGNIASIVIGGSVLGGAGQMGGRFDSGANLGPVKIGHNVRGGTNSYAGGIGAEENLSSVTLGGTLLGGHGDFSGGIEAEGTIGPVKIAHNLAGGAADAGRIVGVDLVSVALGGSLRGGFGLLSGTIRSFGESIANPNGDMGRIKIAQNVIGGTGADSGLIDAFGKVSSLTISGSLIAGTGPGSGSMESERDALAVWIGGNLSGSEGDGAGRVFAKGKLHAVTLMGSLVGGGGSRSGGISAEGGMGVVKVGRDVHGGSSIGESGSIFSRGGDLTNLAIGGSVFGGSGFDSGEIFSSGNAGKIRVGRDVIGGSNSGSGLVATLGKLGSLSVGGSLVGGSGDASGAVTGREVGTVKIGRNLVGGSIAGTTGSLDVSGYIQGLDRLASVSLGGSIFAGWDTSTGGSLTKNASIRAGDDLGTVAVKGSLIGHITSNGFSPVIFSGLGQESPSAKSDLAIKSVRVGGSVQLTHIVGGYTLEVNAVDTRTAFLNNQAQIGSVAVRGDWTASSLVAGILDFNNDGFGNSDDVLGVLGGGSSIAKIAKIVISGVVAGTQTGGDHFGFTSVTIGSLKSLGFTAPLTASTNTFELSPTTGDLTIREL